MATHGDFRHWSERLALVLVIALGLGGVGIWAYLLW